MRLKISNPVEEMVKFINNDLKIEGTEEEYVWNIDKATGIFYLLRKSNKGRKYEEDF